MKRQHRFLALIITAAMLLSMLPSGALAADGENLGTATPTPANGAVTPLAGVDRSATDWADFKAELAGAASGSTITLAASFEATDNATFDRAGVNLLIEGNNHKITRAAAFLDAPIITANAGKLSFQNITLDGGAVWSAGSELLTRTNSGAHPTAQLVTLKGTGEIELLNAAILQNNARAAGAGIGGATAGHSGGCIGVLSADATLRMGAGAQVINNDVTGAVADGGAISVYDGSFFMTGGKISGNTATRHGAVRMLGKNMIMSGGEISGNAVHGREIDSAYTLSVGGLYADRNTTISGDVVIRDNIDATGAPANNTGVFTSGGLGSGAHIGLSGGAHAAVTNASYADLGALFADKPESESLRLGDGTALVAGATADVNIVAEAGRVRVKAAANQTGINLPTKWFETFDAALAAANGDNGALDDNDGAGGVSSHTIEFLASSKTIGSSSISKQLTIEGNNHTLTMEPPAGGYAYSNVTSKTAINNLILTNSGTSDCFHVKAPMTLTNCVFTAGTPVNALLHSHGGTLNIVSGSYSADGKLTSGESFAMTTGNGTNGVTTPKGTFVLNKGAKITLDAASVAPTSNINIKVAENARAGDVIASCTEVGQLAAIAAKITIGDGSAYTPTVVGNDIKLQSKMVYFYDRDTNTDPDDGSLNNPYTSLANAYAAVSDGGEIRAIYSFVQNSTFEVNEKKNVTLTSAFRKSDGTLDTAFTGAWTVSRGAAFDDVLVSVTGGGTLNLKNIVVSGENRQVTAGRLLNVGGTSAGTVNLLSGSALLNSVTAAAGAGAYVFANGVLNQNGGKITSCKMTGTGIRNSAGGVQIESSGAFNLNAGEISDCNGGYGGAVYVGAGANFNMNGGKIARNTTAGGFENGRGGGVFVAGTMTLTAGEISGNNSDCGGGIHIAGTGGKLVTQPTAGKSITIKNNTAASHGAGVHFENGELKFDSVGSGKIFITDNTVGGKAENLYLQNGRTIKFLHDDPGSKIGVTMQTPGDLSVAVATNKPETFLSDNSQYRVLYQTDKLVLVPDPNAYVKEGATGGNGSLLKPFATIEEAYASGDLVASGGEIRLLSDLTQKASMNFEKSGKTLTVISYTDAGVPKTDGNFVITRDKALVSSHLFSVTAGDVVLKNITVDGNKKEVNSTGFTTRALFDVTAGGLTLEDGAILRNNNGGGSYGGGSAGALRITGSGTATMNAGALISGCESASYAGAVLVGNSNSNAARFVMNGGKITANAAGTQLGNAISVWGGTATMNGGEISGNEGIGSGAVGIDGAGSIELSGTARIVDNFSTASGKKVPSNIYLWDGTQLKLNGLTAGASFGVTMQTLPTSTQPQVVAVRGTGDVTASDAGYFFADDAEQYSIRFDDKAASADDRLVMKKFASSVYVANTDAADGFAAVGSDANDGSFAHPFATISKAYSELAPGGTILVCDDIEQSGVVSFNKARATTITSCNQNDGAAVTNKGDAHKITRMADGNCLFTVNAGSVTLKNVILTDNDKAANNFSSSPICVMDKGALTLDTGAEMRDTEGDYAAVYLFGGSLSLKAGSLIKNHTNKGTYGGIAGGNAPTMGAGGAICVGTAGGAAKLVIEGGSITANTAAVGGGIFACKGETSLSGDAVVTGNTNKSGAPDNIYLRTNQLVKVAGALGNAANIGILTEQKPLEGNPVKIVENACAADVAHFRADEMGKAGVRLGTIKEGDKNIFLDVANKAAVEILLANGSSVPYDSFDAASAAIAADSGKGALDDNDSSPSHYTVRLLRNCTTVNGWPAVPIKVTAAADAAGAPQYALTITGLVANANSETELENIKLVSFDGIERMHFYSKTDVTNCELSSFAAVGVTVTLNSGKVQGNVRVDGRAASQLAMKAGAVDVTGEIIFAHEAGKVSLLAGSTAGQRYNLRYADGIDLSGNKIVFDGSVTADSALASVIAKTVTIKGGSDKTKDWVAIGSGNNVIVKLAKAYWVSEIAHPGSAAGNDAADGTFATPFRTIAQAYKAGAAEGGLDIRVLSDLQNTAATTFANPDVISVKISSYLTQNGKAGAPWKISRGAGASALLTANAGSITLSNIALSGAGDKISASAPLVIIGDKATFIMESGSALTENKNVTASARGSGAAVFGTLIMNSGSKVTSNSLVGSGATYGAGVYVGENGKFIMRGGELSGNSVSSNGGSGGAVMIDPYKAGSVYIGGDSVIKKNSCGANGSAIHGGASGVIELAGSAAITENESGASGYVGSAVFPYGSTLCISGAVKISGNTNKGGVPCNVYIPDGKTITVGAGQLRNGAEIGVFCEHMPSEAITEIPVATSATGGDSGYFVSDRATEAGVIFKDETVLLSYSNRELPPTPVGPEPTPDPKPDPDPDPDIDPGVTVDPGPGTVTTFPKNPDPGTTVTVTVDPEPGWEIDKVIIVTVPGGEPVVVTGTDPITYVAPDPNTVKITVTYKKTAVDPKESGVSKLLNSDTHIAFMYGYSDGSFAPESGVTRAEVAQMFFNLLRNKDVDAKAAYSDINDSLWCAKAVNTLTSLGVLKGREGGKFLPDEKISRAEFTAIAARFATMTKGEQSFKDVSDGFWAHDYIVCAAEYGWIKGYADGNFKPQANITRAEAAKIVNTMLARFADRKYIDNDKDLKMFPDVKHDYWAFYDIAEATNTHNFVIDKLGVENWNK